MKMSVTTVRKAANKSLRSQKGFTLIELAIVLAVIAVLATIVIIGRGFLDAARVTKMVEATNTIRKAAATMAGLGGGRLTANAGASQLPGLVSRSFVPNAPWNVQGATYQVTNVYWDNNAINNRVAIQLNVPANTQAAADVFRSVAGDPSFIQGAATNVDTRPCTVAVPGAAITNPTFCFNVN